MPIFHCDAKPFALGSGVGLTPVKTLSGIMTLSGINRFNAT